MPPVVELDLQSAMQMTSELLEGYSTNDFQSKIHAAWEAVGGNEIEWLKARQAICLEVQGPVISRYGFEPNRKGVAQSVRAFQTKPELDHHPWVEYNMQQIQYMISPKMQKEWARDHEYDHWKVDTMDSVLRQSVLRPGAVYKTVHKPFVCILDAPNEDAVVLDFLKVGSLVRIAEVNPPHWGRIDDSEVWARFTRGWARLPKGRGVPKGLDSALNSLIEAEDCDPEVKTCGKVRYKPPPDGTRAEEKPVAAYVMMHGGPIGFDWPFVEVSYDCQQFWEFHQAIEIRMLHKEWRKRHLLPEVQADLRTRFVERCLHYIGTPYQTGRHVKVDKYSFGEWREMDAHGPKHLDCCGLVAQVVEDLCLHFGFKLRGNQSYMFFSLPDRRQSVKELQPGDLIFYQGVRKVPGWRTRKRQEKIVHVEVFLGYQDGVDTVGSLNRSSCARTMGRDGVQRFDSYICPDTDSFTVSKYWFCSLNPWLQYTEENFAHARELLKDCQATAAAAAGL